MPKCKTEDKVLRKTQDILLVVTGPIAMSYEMIWQTKENSQLLDLTILLSCLTRLLQLLSNVNNQVSKPKLSLAKRNFGYSGSALLNLLPRSTPTHFLLSELQLIL